jgi:hypothetical protein
MSIHFVASSTKPVSARVELCRSQMPMNAANDNGCGVGGERLLKAALRHFSEYGLGAAERARENAEAAFFSGNRAQYRWWMAICTSLDRRMAAAVAFHRGSEPAV